MVEMAEEQVALRRRNILSGTLTGEQTLDAKEYILNGTVIIAGRSPEYPCRNYHHMRRFQQLSAGSAGR